MKKVERRCREIATDFADVRTTNEVCLKHFDNMQEFFSFPSTFLDPVKTILSTVFSVESLNDQEKKLLRLVVTEKGLVKELDRL